MTAFPHDCSKYRLLLIIHTFLIHHSLAAFPSCFNHAECTDSSTLTGDNILCFGYESCKYQIIRSTDTANGLKCHGFRSCEQIKTPRNTIDLYSAGDIECSGESSCENANMDASGNVICDGRLSCSNCNIKSSNDVLCSGPSSCSQTNIDATNGEIICDGTFGCANAGIINAENIHCSGNHGCDSSTIIANKVFCDGYYGCTNTRITAQNISAVGANSLHQATVDSTGHVEFSLYVAGANAGVNAKVYCRETTNTCTVRCNGTGCEGTSICYKDSGQLRIFPEYCETNSNGVTNGIHCPTLLFLTQC